MKTNFLIISCLAILLGWLPWTSVQASYDVVNYSFPNKNNGYSVLPDSENKMGDNGQYTVTFIGDKANYSLRNTCLRITSNEDTIVFDLPVVFHNGDSVFLTWQGKGQTDNIVSLESNQDTIHSQPQNVDVKTVTAFAIGSGSNQLNAAGSKRIKIFRKSTNGIELFSMYIKSEYENPDVPSVQKQITVKDSTNWLWSKASSSAKIEISTSDTLLLYNITGITHDTLSFDARAIKICGENAMRNSSVCQVSYLMIKVAQPGRIKVKFSSVGDNTKGQRYLFINGQTTGVYSQNTETVDPKLVEQAVSAGQVVLTAQRTDKQGNQLFRVIELTYVPDQQETKYTVSFDSNGGTGSMPSASYKENELVTLPACTFTAPLGKVFGEWISDDVTIVNNQFTMPAQAVTIKAKWVGVPTVVFNYQPSVAKSNIGVYSYTSSTTMVKQSSIQYKGVSVTGAWFKALPVITAGQWDQYMRIAPAEGGFKQGDTLYISHMYNETSTKSLRLGVWSCDATSLDDFLYKTNFSPNVNDGTTDAKMDYYILTEDVDSLFIAHAGSNATRIVSNIIRVVRPAEKDILSRQLASATIDGEAITDEQLSELATNHTLTIAAVHQNQPVVKLFEKVTYVDSTFMMRTVSATVVKDESEWVATAMVNNVTYTIRIAAASSYSVRYYDGSTFLLQEWVNPGQKAQWADSAAGVVSLPACKGWFADLTLTIPADFNNVITQDTIFYGDWNYAIHYVLDGGAGTPTPTTYHYSATADTKINGKVTKTGYTFKGWELLSAHAIRSAISKGTYGDQTCVAVLMPELAQSIDCEANAQSGMKNDSNKIYLYKMGYDYKNINAPKVVAGNNGAKVGLLVNNATCYLSFVVPAGQVVDVKLGYMSAAAEMYINGTLDTQYTLSGGSTVTGNPNFATYTYTTDQQTTFKLQMTTASECYIKGITIRTPETKHQRTGLVGNYATVCLPYDVDMTNVIGAEIFEVDYIDQSVNMLYFNQLEESGIMNAGQAYLLRYTSSEATFTYTLGTQVTDSISGEQARGFIGTLNGTVVPSGDNWYGIYSTMIQPIVAGVAIMPKRAYIDLDEVPTTPKTSSSPRRVAFGVQRGTPTGIVQAVESNETQITKRIINGQLMIIRGEHMYNIQGQQVK